ncbi:MAG: cupin domain-containing protein [Gemmatimonadales bacterium]
MDLGTPRLFRWDDLPKEAVTAQLGRKIITGEHVMAAHVWLEKGTVVPLHSHEAEQLSFTFSGALKFIIGGETIVVGPGQLLVIPSKVPHEAVALEDTYEMDVFSPIRHDWLARTDSYFNAPPTQPAGYEKAATGANPATLYRWADVTTERITDGIERIFATGERATLADLRLAKGVVVPTHQHPAEQLTWVRSGHLRLEVGSETFEVPAGSVLRIPAMVPHQATAVEDTVVTDMFSPRRDDWLEKNDAYLRQGKR